MWDAHRHWLLATEHYNRDVHSTDSVTNSDKTIFVRIPVSNLKALVTRIGKNQLVFHIG